MIQATTTTASELIAAVRLETDRPVAVEQTGGGVATLFVGNPNEDGIYALAIGPGTYDWGNPSRSEFDFVELFVGPDNGEGTGRYVTSVDDLRAAVRQELRT